MAITALPGCNQAEPRIELRLEHRHVQIEQPRYPPARIDCRQIEGAKSFGRIDRPRRCLFDKLVNALWFVTRINQGDCQAETVTAGVAVLAEEKLRNFTPEISFLEASQ